MRAAFAIGLGIAMAMGCGSTPQAEETDAGQATLSVTPEGTQSLIYELGQTPPSLQYEASYDGSSVEVTWSVDRPSVLDVSAGPSASTTVSATGMGGGTVTLTAVYQGQSVQRDIQVQIHSGQNGPNGSPEEDAQIADEVSDLTEGGGVGGVGGEGLGVEVTDADTLEALQGDSPTANSSLTLLYPYDKTVWPLDLPAPLLQWNWDGGDVDAIKIELATESGSFAYEGLFGAPAILSQTGGSFVRHPIPQGAWNIATESASQNPGDSLHLRLTLSKGGEAFGPIEQSYTIAPARLAGTIYYQSYGTNLAKNYSGAVGGDNMFGGAVLSIKVGDVAPKLTAGSSGGRENCRVCHSVAAGGSRLIAQSSEPTDTYYVDIDPMGTMESALATDTAFPGLTPDGHFALTNNRQLLDLDNGGMSVGTTGLEDIGNMGTTMFSPDGNRVAFNPMGGAAVAHPKQSIMVMDFDDATQVFSNAIEVVDTSASSPEGRPGWPAFLPSSDALVFQQQIAAGLDGNSHWDLRTRKNAKSYLAWVKADGTGSPTPLNQANGAGYLPSLEAPVNLTCTADGSSVGATDNDHADDVNLNYEPTVNPVGSGGFAWMVFTSRRMYGNVATIPPFCSDPRGVDLIQNITTKKLWVAAIDLNAPAGSDPSHPAFYLPAQELLAGNARGFWVLDPCKPSGDSCDSGDQCCGGYCNPQDDVAGALCADDPVGGCSLTQDACTETADCCDASDACINNFCTTVGID